MNPSSFDAFLLHHPLPSSSAQAAPAASSSAGPLIAGQPPQAAEPGPTLGLSEEFSIDDFLDMSQFELDHGGGLGLGQLEADEAGAGLGFGLGPPGDFPAGLKPGPGLLQPAPAPPCPAASTLSRSVSFADEPQVIYFQPNDVPHPSPGAGRAPARSSLRGATPLFPPASPAPTQGQPSPPPAPVDTPSPHARESSGSASPEPAKFASKPAVKARRKNFARPVGAPIRPRPKPAPPPPAKSTAGPPPSSRKRRREPELKIKLRVPSEDAVTGEEQGEVSVPDEHRVIPEEVLDQLEADDQAVPFPRLGIPADDGSLTVVGTGDVVQVSHDFGLKAGHAWLGLVTEAQGLTADEHQVTETDGTPKRDQLGHTMTQFSTAYVGLKWVYARQDFDNLKRENSRVTHLFSREMHTLGPNERVLTDHFEHYRQERVVKGQVRALYFNDQYPGGTDYGLVGSRKHPLKVAAHRRTIEYDTVPPPYFFGVVASLSNGGSPDGEWTGAVVIRTELALQGERVVQPDDEAEAEHKPKHKKRKHRLTLYPPKQHSSVDEYKHLTFNRFSPSNQPYQFDHVQIYSHAKDTWFTVEDLRTKYSYKPVAKSIDGARPSPLPTVEADGPLVPLARLGREPIVRGGVFGITGNAYLVTRANELFMELVFASGSDVASSDAGNEDAEAQRADEEEVRRGLLQEAVVLLSESILWKGWVEVRRRKGRASVKRKGKEEEAEVSAEFALCPPPYSAGRLEQRWIPRVEEAVGILTREEEVVLRQWQEEGMWPGK